jgi:hypothetical protein
MFHQFSIAPSAGDKAFDTWVFGHTRFKPYPLHILRRKEQLQL